MAIHLIDITLTEKPSGLTGRYQLIGDLFFQHFQPLTGEVMGRNGDWAEALRFHCNFVSNPDNVMRSWGKLVPQRKEVFETSQVCTLVLAGLTK